MSNLYVLDTSSRKCPVGSLATHGDYGWCQIVSADGLLRGIEYETREPEFTSESGELDDEMLSEEMLLSEIITLNEAIVDVRELRPASQDQLPEQHSIKLALFPLHRSPLIPSDD